MINLGNGNNLPISDDGSIGDPISARRRTVSATIETSAPAMQRRVAVYPATSWYGREPSPVRRVRNRPRHSRRRIERGRIRRIRSRSVGRASSVQAGPVPGRVFRHSQPLRHGTAKSALDAVRRNLVGRTIVQVPCVDGSELARRIFTSRCWSVQPCVRPLDAVHMTAGHNALRGSGPGQNPAFDNALALVGCPDRRIDRLCITCCSPSQPSHHAVASLGSPIEQKPVVYVPPNFVVTSWSPTLAGREAKCSRL